MGCCDCLGKTVLIVINILFSLVGLVLLVTGCVVRFNDLDALLSDAYSAFATALEDAGVPNPNLENFSIGELVGDATLAFIIIGAFFFVIGIFGCVGACCKVKCFLVLYAVTLIVVFIAELVFVILLFTIRSTVDAWVHDPLTSTMEDHYTGINGTDGFTLAMNFVMHELECCGILNYTEFKNATKWPNRTTDVVPKICCKNSTNGCEKSPNVNNSFIGQPCFDAVEEWLTKYDGIMIGVGAGTAAIQLILIIFAFVVCCNERKKDNDSSYDDDIPIQPYRESKDTGYNEIMYQGQSNHAYRSDGRGPDYGARTPSAPYDREYGQEPYQGRHDYYRGPPDGYRAGYQKHR